MNKYTLYCTPEQTKKALELGVPLYKYTSIPNFAEIIEISENNYVEIPTAEQLINWFRVCKDLDLYIRPCYEETNKGVYEKVGYTYEISTVSKTVLNPYLTYEEAQSQGIDTALEYLINEKLKSENSII